MISSLATTIAALTAAVGAEDLPAESRKIRNPMTARVILFTVYLGGKCYDAEQ
jgi:hypothetical protein